MVLSILKSKMSCKTFELLTWNITPKRLQWEKCTWSQLQSACEGCGNCGRDVHGRQTETKSEISLKCVSQAVNSDVEFCMILMAISIQQCPNSGCSWSRADVKSTKLQLWHSIEWKFILVLTLDQQSFISTWSNCRLKHGRWKKEKILRNNTCTWKLKKLSEINAPKS